MRNEAPLIAPYVDAEVADAAPARSWRRRLEGVPWLFVIVVVLPTTLAAVYYLLIAAPLYVSEAQFVVQHKNQSQSVGLGNMLASVGVSLGGESETDAYEVQGYMLSRDALSGLVDRHRLREMLQRPEADFLWRFPRFFETPEFENLFKSYPRFVDVNYDMETGISTLRVEAFTPEDSREIARGLLDSAEDLINRLNDRAMSDAVAQYQKQVDDAERRVIETQAALTTFRDRKRLINPDFSSTSGLDLLGKLETQLASLRAERAGLAASSADSPQLQIMDRRIAAFSAQLEDERTRLAGQVDSLAPALGEYERLTLKRDLAAKTLEAAVAGLETALLEARRQQLFLNRVVDPGLPDKSERPRRWLLSLIVLVSSFVAYGIVSLAIAGLREHRQA